MSVTTGYIANLMASSAYQPIVMKSTHSNDSIVTAVVQDEDSTIPQYALGSGYQQTPINQPDLSEMGKYLDRLFMRNYLRLLRGGGRKLNIVGIIGSNDKGCLAYERNLLNACLSLGVEFEVFDCIGEEFDSAKALIAMINGRGDVDGMIVFTPIFGDQRVSRGYWCFFGLPPFHLDVPTQRLKRTPS